MKRYSSTQTNTRWDGKRVYKTTSYPTISPLSQYLQIVSSEGDYLDTLAYKYYGDPTLWFIIATANPGLGKGRLSIPPGSNLKIPIDVNGFLSRFNNINS